MPIPVAEPSKAWVYGRSLVGTAGSNPAEGMAVSAVIVLCCQVEVSASGWSLVQRSPTECGVSECDREASKGEAMTRIRAEESQEKKKGRYEGCSESIQSF